MIGSPGNVLTIFEIQRRVIRSCSRWSCSPQAEWIALWSKFWPDYSQVLAGSSMKSCMVQSWKMELVSDSNISSHDSKSEMHFVDNNIRNSNFLMKKDVHYFRGVKPPIGWSFLVFVLWHSENLRCHAAGEIKLHYMPPNKRPEMAPDYPRFEMKPSQKSKYSSNQQVCFIFFLVLGSINLGKTVTAAAV